MTPTPRYAIGVDIGGTSARCGLVSARGQIRRGSHRKIAVASKGPADAILETFASLLGENIAQAKREKLHLEGIGIGMCGPLDYEEGIVLMRGLDKYEALYGMNLKQALRARLHLEDDFPIRIEPDSWAFARGEAWMGAGRTYRRVLALTLGTGLGSAFVEDGRLLGDGPGIPPPFGWIGSLPFRGTILDDFISRRGILSLYRALAQEAPPSPVDVRDIALRARAGDPVCRQVFEGFGHLLGGALAPVVTQFGAECLIFGGRISQAFDLFSESVRCGLGEAPTLQRITLAQSVDLATLRGAAHLVFANRQ